MQMDMKNRLTSVTAVVDHQPIATALEASFLCDTLRDKEQMTDPFAVFLPHAVNIRDMVFRNDKDMCRRLRIDVLKGDGKIILMYKPCRDRFLDDLAEDAILFPGHAASYLSKRR